MPFNVSMKYLFTSFCAATMWQSNYWIHSTHLLWNCAVNFLHGGEGTGIHIISNFCTHISRLYLLIFLKNQTPSNQEWVWLISEALLLNALKIWSNTLGKQSILNFPVELESPFRKKQFNDKQIWLFVEKGHFPFFGLLKNLLGTVFP